MAVSDFWAPRSESVAINFSRSENVATNTSGSESVAVKASRSENVAMNASRNESVVINSLVRETENLSMRTGSSYTENIVNKAPKGQESIARQNQRIETSDNKHVAPPIDSDSDEDDDDGLEEERLAFTISKADEFCNAQNWEKAEGYLRTILKIIEKNKNFKPKAGEKRRIDWISKLMAVQAELKKWDEALITTQYFTKADLVELAGQGEHWQAYFYYRLGDLESAKKRCKKAIKTMRGNSHQKNQLDELIKLMIRILTEAGDVDEVEFYLALAPPETAASIQQTTPAISHSPTRHELDTLSRAPRNQTVASNTETVLASAIPEAVPAGPYSEERKVLWIWDLDFQPDGRSIRGSEEAVDKAIKHAIESNDVILADSLFSDPQMLVRNSLDDLHHLNRIPPLHQAVDRNKLDMVRFLLKKGADVLAYTDNGASTLDYAIERGNVKMIKFLIDCGYPVDRRDRLDSIPLHRACIGNRDDSTIRVLLENGANIEIRNGSGMTPLIHAATAPYLQFAPFKMPFEILLAEGADPNATDKAGNTALHYAAKGLSEECIRILLRYGANRRAKNNQGQRPRDLATDAAVQRLLR
ncbi:Ankyrin-3 [Dactylellina cionopaga]|nr:Ankyrin-3 [Dactylellina cionopaga]